MSIHNKPIPLRVEGWLGVSHSYALVNQFQLLAFQKLELARVQYVAKGTIVLTKKCLLTFYNSVFPNKITYRKPL